jgi:hypothetical protein
VAKRTSPFQQIVRDVESQLQAVGTVRESLKVPNRDGDLREVDVVIDIHSGAQKIRAALECRAHSRKADLLWIDELSTKYRDIQSVNCVIAVSSAGFSPRALKKAQALGIRTLTLGQATSADWNEMLRGIGTDDVAIRDVAPETIESSALLHRHFDSAEKAPRKKPKDTSQR